MYVEFLIKESLFAADIQRDADASKQLPAERNEIISNAIGDAELEDTDEQSKGKIQFPTAEIADAVLGSAITSNQKTLLSLIQNIKSEHSTFEVKDSPCTDASGENGECSVPKEVVPSLAHAPSSSPEGELPEKKATNAVEPAQTVSAAVEESNATGTAKSPKVNCEERNITGLDHFIVQILNSSQVRQFEISIDLVNLLMGLSGVCFKLAIVSVIVPML